MVSPAGPSADAREGQLTEGHYAALTNLGIHPDMATSLVDAGVPADTAIAILQTRSRHGIVSSSYSDALLYAVLPDADLLLRAVQCRWDTADLADAIRDGDITPGQMAVLIAQQVDPEASREFLRTGGAVDVLADAARRHPGLTVGSLVTLLGRGITADDLDWLASTGTTLSSRIPSETVASAHRLRHAGNRLTRTDQRRLLLVLLNGREFTVTAAVSLVTALRDSPYLDTVTTLILDGTAVDEAIELGRADHRVEQHRPGQHRPAPGRAGH